MRDRHEQDRARAFLDHGREHRAALVRVARAEGVSAEDAVECVQDALCTLLGQEQRGELLAPPAEWRFVLAHRAKASLRICMMRHEARG